ncbi:MAG TPA: RagB/SusD family nutrient uptake outer membrane protein [Draconibacterium sp.]|nr:RagB/SusD family nutrient uptake outer membrane protein [Draconibacterium sp.]
MKRLKYIIILGFAIFFAGCQDFLDQSPSDALPTSEAISSVTDLGYAVNGVYSGMIDFDLGLGQNTEPYSYYGGDFIAYADLKGGDIDYTASNNQISPMARFEHGTESSFAEHFWQIPYTLIGRINDILSVVETINVETGEEDQYNDLKGQLYALRALMHFDVARLFAKLPSTTDVNAANSGIPISNEKYPVDYEPTRSTLEQTYTFIKNDLSTALSLLSQDQNLGRINYWAAKGLLARVHLYLEENSEALSAAQEVINNSPYSLYTINNYLNVWGVEGASEAMFEILTTPNHSSQRNSIGYYTHASGYGECAYSVQGYELLTADANDIRSQLIEWEDDETDTQGYYTQKYPGRDGNLYLNNPIVIRLSEVYLIAAEAKLKGGNASGDHDAAWYLNELRKNRITGYTDVASVTLDDILTERRKELVAEGHRCWDAWRNGRSVYSPSLNQEIGADFNRAILPIPKRETDISSGLEQNPGYN